MRTLPRKRLTEGFRRLEAEVELAADGDYRFGSAGEFSVRVASSLEDRLAAWRLAYDVYRGKEYAAPDPQELWYSVHDALPETVTVLVERSGELIGAVTVIPDSPLGLPADRVFPAETSALRQSGGVLAEAVSLVQGGVGERAGMVVAARLCEFTCLVAERLLGASDLVITVNPRHERYYRRVMLFERRGEEVPCDKVSGALAVFLTLNFKDMDLYVRTADLIGGPRTIYRRFMKPEEAAEVADHLAGQRSSLSTSALREYFLYRRNLFRGLAPQARAWLKGRYTRRNRRHRSGTRELEAVR